MRGPSLADSTRQALLARLLAGTVEQPLHPGASRAVGELCATSATSDLVDAHLALLAHDHDRVVTSHSDDLRALCERRSPRPGLSAAEVLAVKIWVL